VQLPVRPVLWLLGLSLRLRLRRPPQDLASDEAVIEPVFEAEKGERPAEEVIRELRANRVVLLFLPVNVAIFAAVILDMVLKPF
jgi:hypothetical protein